MNQGPSNKKFNAEEWKTWLSFVKNFLNPKKIVKKDQPLVHVINGNDSRPFLKVSIFNRFLNGLLDSGSEISIINPVVLRSLTGHVEVCRSHDIDMIVSATGSTAPVDGFVNLPVTVGSKTIDVKFYVIPNVTTDLLFGINFWWAFGLAPDILNCCGKDPGGMLDSPQVSQVHIQGFDLLSESQKRDAQSLFGAFEDISAEKKGLGRTHLITHHIDTGDAKPIKQRHYMLSRERLRELNRQLDEMLRDDVVEPSSSPWNSPVTLAPKADGSLRFCLDSRKLNEVSKHDSYPLPYITHILDQLKEARYLSSIDLKSAFHQIPLDEASKEKTAFTIPGRGLFQYKVMCFGLTSAPATQQRLMDKLFGPEFGGKVFTYLDDVICVSSSFEEHLSLLRVVLDRFREANLTINLSKSRFFRKQLKYLGYIVDENGLRTDPEKVRAIEEFPTPTCRKDVKRFLGTASYYRRFIKDFSTIAGPLNALTSTRKGKTFQWSAEAERAFIGLKTALMSAPVLSCPDFDHPFAIHCDASDFGIGGTLTQTINGEEHPIAYFSRSLTPCERNYSATEREALAVVNVVEHFRPYLEGSTQFKIYTDHASLKWFLNLKNPTGRLERWGCRLSPYNFIIEHRKGVDNVVPDALSRAVQTAATVPATSDAWYLNIVKRCQENPKTCPNFQFTNGKLFRYTKSKSNLLSDFEWKEVIPADFRNNILCENHAEPTAAHLGIAKTYQRLRLRYYWPGMYQDTITYIAECDICNAYKNSNKPTPGLMGSPRICSRPFQCLSIDLIGPLPLSRQQHCYILVVVCYFSKYCLLFPLRRATGKVIAQRLEDHVFLVHGIPQTIMSDNGSQFTGREVQSLFEKYSIPQLHFGPVYCPQVNPVERQNRTIMTAVSSFVGSDHRTWDVNIHRIQFAINTSVSIATSYTPFFLVHGREAVPNGNVYGDFEDIDELIFSSRKDYALNLGELDLVFKNVKAELHKAHDINAKYYNNRRRDLDFEIGDIVWKRSFKQSDASKYFSAKLSPKYEKCRVVRKLSRLVYELEDESGKPLGKWHIKDFKNVGQ